jgi:hypothetical protein
MQHGCAFLLENALDDFCCSHPSVSWITSKEERGRKESIDHNHQLLHYCTVIDTVLIMCICIFGDDAIIKEMYHQTKNVGYNDENTAVVISAFCQ